MDSEYLNRKISEIDGHLLDGIVFVQKVYRIFNYASSTRDGVAAIRSRKGLLKELVEELLPLAWYVQSTYRYRRKNRVKWINGNQSHEAYVVCESERRYIEMTIAVRQNAHLARELLNEKGASGHPMWLSRDKATREIVSRPAALEGKLLGENTFAETILEAIRKKLRKNYPPDTILIVQCEGDAWFSDQQWRYIFNRVFNETNPGKFRAIHLIDSGHTRLCTIEHESTGKPDST